MLSKNYLKSIEKVNNSNTLILHTLFDSNDVVGNNITNIQLFKDIHLFEDKNILHYIDKNQSDLGKIMFQYNLLKPTSILKNIISNQLIINYYFKHNLDFTIIQTNIEKVLWFYKERTEEEHELLNIILFNSKYFKWINTNYYVLYVLLQYKFIVLPIMLIIYPLILLLSPYFLLKYYFKLSIPIKVYINVLKSNPIFLKNIYNFSGFGFMIYNYIQTLYNQYQLLKNSYNIIQTLFNHIQSVANIYNFYLNIEKSFPNKLLLIKYDAYKLEFLKNKIWTSDYSIFTDKAYIITMYLTFNRIKHYFIPVLKNIGIIESYYSLSRLIKSNSNYSFTKFTNEISPTIKIKDLWHPILTSNSIKNNLDMNVESNKEVIITGPNAGGKSTFIRSILFSILFSQTYGISCSTFFSSSVFNRIESYITIPDIEGEQSLFQAEMNRCKDILKNISKYKQHNKTLFIVMDEIFNSTNHIEGLSAGYALINELNKYTNCLNIITTHYSFLTTLSKKRPNINNYKVSAHITDNNITFPYKITKGRSNQYIALELLKKNGFSAQFIKKALKIKNLLTNNKPSL